MKLEKETAAVDRRGKDHGDDPLVGRLDAPSRSLRRSAHAPFAGVGDSPERPEEASERSCTPGPESASRDARQWALVVVASDGRSGRAPARDSRDRLRCNRAGHRREVALAWTVRVRKFAWSLDARVSFRDRSSCLDHCLRVDAAYAKMAVFGCRSVVGSCDAEYCPCCVVWKRSRGDRKAMPMRGAWGLLAWGSLTAVVVSCASAARPVPPLEYGGHCWWSVENADGGCQVTVSTETTIPNVNDPDVVNVTQGSGRQFAACNASFETCGDPAVCYCTDGGVAITH